MARLTEDQESELSVHCFRLIEASSEFYVDWEYEKQRVADRFGISKRTVERRLKSIRHDISTEHLFCSALKCEHARREAGS